MAGVLHYCAENLARPSGDYQTLLLNSAGTALTADTGYDPDHIADGIGETPWRSAAAATSHRVTIENGATGPWPLTCAAAFDVAPVTAGVRVSAVRFQGSNAGATGPWTDVAVLTENGRGDWARRFAQVDYEWTSYLFELSSSSKLDVGEIFHGLVTALPVNAAQINRTPLRATNVNQSSGGSRWRAKFAKERMSLSLPFAPLTPSQDAAVRAMVDAADGALGDVALWPIADRSEFYLGGIEDETSASEDASGLLQGRSVAFIESARAL